MKNKIVDKKISSLVALGLLLVSFFGFSNVALARPGLPVQVASPLIEVITTSSDVIEKDYRDGDLVRYCGEDRVYRVVAGEMEAIRSLKDLAKYAGQEILNITKEGRLYVEKELVVATPKQAVLGVKKYADGTLLRYKGEDTIYVMAFSQMTPLRHIEQLKNYPNQEIITISRYEEIREVLGIKKYGEGVLLRDSNMKIYAVIGSELKHIRSLEELSKYSGQEIIDVDDETLTYWDKQ